MRNARWQWIIVFIIILITAGLVGFTVRRKTITVNKGNRQAVYLTNGQVYFGYLGDPNATYVALRDPFYPQSEQTGSNARRTITLNPLGETYTTENVMYINQKQILHFENLADNSKVNTAINNFKDTTTSPSPSIATTPSPTPTSTPLN